MRVLVKPRILKNLVKGVYIVIEEVLRYKSRFVDEKVQEAATQILKFYRNRLKPTGLEALDSNLATAILLLNKSDEFQAIFQSRERSSLQLPFGWDYFIQKLYDYPTWVIMHKFCCCCSFDF